MGHQGAAQAAETAPDVRGHTGQKGSSGCRATVGKTAQDGPVPHRECQRSQRHQGPSPELSVRARDVFGQQPVTGEASWKGF